MVGNGEPVGDGEPVFKNVKKGNKKIKKRRITDGFK